MDAFTLMAHQEEGVAFLLGRRSGLLAFEQGLGKTLVAIEAFHRLRATGDADLMVVICPNSLKRNWAAELRRFAPELPITVVEEVGRKRRLAIGDHRGDVLVINYEGARAEITALRGLLSRKKSVLTLDESHYVKNRQSLTTVAAQHLAPLAPYRWLLTGTPVTNSPADVFTQISLVADDAPLGSFDRFTTLYADADRNVDRQRELADRIAPFLLRRTKEQCLDLPDKTFVDIYVELPRWQRQLYDDMRDGIIREVRGMTGTQFRAFASTALTRLLRLSQIASNPRLLLQDEARTPAKAAELDRLLEELLERNGRKVILWSYYVGTIELFAHRYARYGAVKLYGGVPGEERQEVARRFQEDPATRLLIANPAAAGTGFTLTAASYTIYESLTWRYDLYAQSQDRNHRIGQRVPVTYLRLLAEDTIDEVIADVLSRKTKMAQNILADEAIPLPISSMTPPDFCRMLQENVLP